MITDSSILRRLIVVLRDSSDAITLQDLNGNILAWNRGAEKLYGYSEDEALKMNVRKLIPDDLHNNELSYLERISAGEIIESFETIRITKSNERKYIWITATCLVDDNGISNSIGTTERDITKFINEIEKKNEEVKILRGLLPICASCKKIRDYSGKWHQIESYIRSHSEAEFSHGICPECLLKLYPDFKYEPQK